LVDLPMGKKTRHDLCWANLRHEMQGTYPDQVFQATCSSPNQCLVAASQNMFRVSKKKWINMTWVTKLKKY
jgi:hypothetical protein